MIIILLSGLLRRGGLMPSPVSRPELLRKLAGGGTFVDKSLRFAWAGGLKPGQGHYYRIVTDRYLIEYDNVQGGANHIHAVWRDFDGDFGEDLLRTHYQESPH